MTYFTKRLKTPEGDYNFYFNLIHTIAGTSYHVSFVDSEKKPYVFNMKMEAGNWRIVNLDDLPMWTVVMESELSELIIPEQISIIYFNNVEVYT